MPESRKLVDNHSYGMTYDEPVRGTVWEMLLYF